MKETREPTIQEQNEGAPERTLENRFRLFFERVSNGQAEQAIFKNLTEKYSDEGRSYHTLNHVAQCLRELDDAITLTKDADAIEMATWFHDVVYDTKRDDNEEKSAQMFKEQMGKFLPPEFVDKVCKLILATKHREVPEDLDSKIMVDIDLSILGQSEGKFDEYETQIREEYKRFPDEEFNKGRKKVLQSFLARSEIYLTEHFREKYEDRARKNIEKSLEKLK